MLRGGYESKKKDLIPIAQRVNNALSRSFPAKWLASGAYLDPVLLIVDHKWIDAYFKLPKIPDCRLVKNGQGNDRLLPR